MPSGRAYSRRSDPSTKHATRHLSPTVPHRLPLTSALATASGFLLLAACANPRQAAPDVVGSTTRPDVAFVSNRDGNHEIYLLTSDATEPVNLTRNPALDYWLCWAPDGERLAFGSNRDGNNDVFVMNADGSGCVNLTRHPAADKWPSWSPDGTTIAFLSDRDHSRGEIYTMAADGSGVRRLTDNADYEEAVAWYPDGRSLAFCRLVPPIEGSEDANNGEIFVMARDGTNARRLTHRPGFDSGPAWSPDGNRLAFHGLANGAVDIFVMAADGSGLVNLTADATEDWQPAWSPDGASIAWCAGSPPHAYDI